MIPHGAVAVALAVCSVFCYALAAALQRRETARVSAMPAPPAGGWPFFRALARRGWWWTGVATMGAGAGIHVVALGFGSVTLVQPIGVTALILALPLDARLEHRRVTRAEWGAAAVLVVGLVGVVVLAPHGGRPIDPPPWLVVATAFGTLAVVAVLVAISLRVGRRAAAVLRGACAGLCAGATSGMVRLVFLLTHEGNPPGLVVAIALVAVVILPIAGLLLLQTAYRDGGLDAGLALQTSLDPSVASFIGIVVLGERFSAGAFGVSLAGFSAVVAVAALVVLVRVSPDVSAGEALSSAPSARDSASSPG